MGDLLLESRHFPHQTLGILSYKDFVCATVELPWRDNERNVSCIPAGEYALFKRESPRNGHVLQFCDVPGRSFIQIHKGNFTYQIAGCILLGDGLAFLDDDHTLDTTNSGKTLSKLLAKLPEELSIKVVRE